MSQSKKAGDPGAPWADVPPDDKQLEQASPKFQNADEPACLMHVHVHAVCCVSCLPCTGEKNKSNFAQTFESFGELVRGGRKLKNL